MGWHDTALVCRRGHMINDRSQRNPQWNTAFCKKCGSVAMSTCTNCDENIPGDYHDDSSGLVFIRTRMMDAPSHCKGCGKAYPWAPGMLAKLAEIKRIALGNWKQNTAVVCAMAVLGFISQTGRYWNDLPQEWRSWLVNHAKQVQQIGIKKAQLPL